MAIPSNVLTYLAETEGEFRLYTVPPTATILEAAAGEGIRLEQLALALLVKCADTPLMVIVRADQELDSNLLTQRIGREVELCGTEESASLSGGCDNEWLPPLPALFGLRAIFDIDFSQLETIFFPVGSAGQFIQTSGATFQSLLRCHTPEVEIPAAFVDSPSWSELSRYQAEEASRLPAIPAIAAEITRVRDNPYSQASELAAVIEQDVNLSAQLMRYATSPWYCYEGTAESVEQALTRVGMDFGADFALGLALGKTFTSPEGGEGALRTYWDHALYPASLAQALCNAIDFYRRPSPGVAYLCGLLHNVGFLLMEQLYPGCHDKLNSARLAQPGRSTLELEREMLGVDHTEIGLLLMDAWKMPVEVSMAVQHHHDSEFSDEYAVYVNLVTIANILLKRHGIGDAEAVELPPGLLEAVGLDNASAETALATVMAGSEGLSFMASKMAA